MTSAISIPSDPAVREPSAPRPRSTQLRSLAVRVVGVSAAIAVIAFAFARYRANAAKPMAHYETVGIDRGPLDAKVTATGAVSPLITVQVGSQVSGRIARLYVDFGSTVSSGQIVATIEPSLFRAAVAQAAANLASARASVVKAQAQKEEADKLYARDKALLAEGLATRTDYDVAESNALVAAADIAAGQASVAQAQATLAQAELNLKYTTITSPIDGIVISR
ncbi:MAG TPA: biotin/lipoyl-binding protein, partial [Polyangiaceae bacterium]|nr:biotin/lipoyl-binding protein [Polyangiaceae bacterium]